MRRWSPRRSARSSPSPVSSRSAHVDLVADMLAGQFPAVAQMLLDAKADLTAFADVPDSHWRKIWSTNPLERLNREVKRRTDVVGIFPNPAALLRLSSCVLIEAHDEWQDSDRRYLSERSMALLNPPAPTVLEPKTPSPNTTPYGIVALTRTAPRNELHHSRGREPPLRLQLRNHLVLPWLGAAGGRLEASLGERQLRGLATP